MRELTDRQRAIYEWVLAFQAKHAMPPTVREIGRHFRIASSSVFAHLKLIEKKGLIRRGRLGARSLEVASGARKTAKPAAPTQAPAPAFARDDVTVSVPEVGRVAAGAPLLAAENVDRAVQLDPALLKGPPDAQYFMLRVTGESMIDAGILDGDRVVVRQQSTARDGQIVVALLGDEATVKYFHREPGRVRLQPANVTMKPIYAKEVSIQGVVVCVLRTYG